MVAVGTRVTEAFEDQHAAAFAPPGAVGIVGEGAAATARRNRPELGEFDEHAGGGHNGDAPGESEVRFATTQ